MEIIAALVAEVLFPVFAVFVSAMASLVSGLVEAIFGVTLSIWKPESKKDEDQDRPKNKFLRKLTYIGLGCFSLISLMFVLLNLFWFESAFSWMIQRIENKHDIQIQYEKLEGNLLQSKLVLHGMDIQRQNHPASNFELRSEKVEARFSTFKILMSSQINSLSISGVNGAFIKNPTPKKDWQIKLPKNFEIKDLQLSQIHIDLNFQNQESIPIYIEDWHSPFHSRYFIFQFLFRGNGNGSVCKQNFRVTTQRLANGGKLSWSFQNLPLSLIQNQLPKPMPWATSGTFDLEVSDEWESEPQLSLDTRWSITLKEHEFLVPEDAKTWDHALAKILANFDPMPINFSLKVNAEQFEGKADLGATQIWPMILEKIADQITTPGGDKEQSKKSIRKGIELGKDLLDKARKKNDEN